MSIYHSLKRLFTNCVLSLKKHFFDFNQRMNSRKRIKDLIRNNAIPKLTPQEDYQVKLYFKSKGYTLKHTDWHAYYKAMNGKLHNEYIPLGFFKSKISPKLNQKLQWPGLLDKNIIYRIFCDFEQPKRVVQNINGFYYINDKAVNKTKAIKTISNSSKQLVIKPTIESGAGKNVVVFSINNIKTSYQNLTVEALISLYKKDFIVQEFLEQSDTMSQLNPISTNTLRVMSYLNNDAVHILSTTARVGGLNSSTDNYSTGGLLCGVDVNGRFKDKGYTKKGEILDKSFTGVKLSDCFVPNYSLVKDMVKSMHVKIPYFKLVSWDIAINKKNEPVMIEYNTYNQGLEIQIVSGPLFGEFTDEILTKGLE